MYIDGTDLDLASGDTLGGRISLARDACDVSVDDAADMTGVDRDVWQAWENDRDAPIATDLEIVARSLQVSLAWLITGRGVGPKWDN
jgi:transcriptional regulator with XRE-family HTH domain